MASGSRRRSSGRAARNDWRRDHVPSGGSSTGPSARLLGRRPVASPRVALARAMAGPVPPGPRAPVPRPPGHASAGDLAGRPSLGTWPSCRCRRRPRRGRRSHRGSPARGGRWCASGRCRHRASGSLPRPGVVLLVCPLGGAARPEGERAAEPLRCRASRPRVHSLVSLTVLFEGHHVPGFVSLMSLGLCRSCP